MSNGKLTKNERRELAREQARKARAAEVKREKRNRLLIQGGVVVGVLAIIGIVVLVITMSMRPAGPGPANMASGGVVFTEDLAVESTPALADGEPRVAPAVNRDQLPLDITVYVDYFCVHCAQFEATNGMLLENWVGSGDATLEIYPVTILDAGSGGSKYSTRAANALGCMVEQSPEDGVAFNFHNNLLGQYEQASQNQGLTDEQLVELASQSGFSVNDQFRQCVKNVNFSAFFAKNTKAATETGILGLAPGAQLLAGSDGSLQPADGPQTLTGTPLVIVNGQQWVTTTNDYSDFESYLLKVRAEIEGNGADDTDADGDSTDGTAGDDAAREEEAAETE